MEPLVEADTEVVVQPERRGTADAVAVCALLRPDLLHFEDWHVAVETQGAFCRGATVGDRRTAPNARVITGIDREGFAELLTEAVRTYG